MDVYERSLKLHEEKRGKFEVRSLVEVKDREALSLAYTPGVAQPCREIAKGPFRRLPLYPQVEHRRRRVRRQRRARAGQHRRAGGVARHGGQKASSFREFAGIDAIPIVLSGQDEDDIVRAVEMIAPSFGGINLEDICAPKCFSVERRLKEKLDIPVFHDDQHGTAIVVSAALMNALKLADKQLSSAKIVICGAGSAGIAIANLLLECGAEDVILADRGGLVCEGEPWLTGAQAEMARRTNRAAHCAAPSPTPCAGQTCSSACPHPNS